MKHLIYSRLESPNVMTGKGYSVEFLPGVTTEISDKDYNALADNDAFVGLIDSGDLIEKSEKMTNDIATLKSNIVKAQEALKKAEDAQAETDKIAEKEKKAQEKQDKKDKKKA